MTDGMKFYARIEARVNGKEVVHQHAFTTDHDDEAQERLTATLAAIEREFVRKTGATKKERREAEAPKPQRPALSPATLFAR